MGCAVSILGDIHNQTERGPEQQLQLALLLAGGLHQTFSRGPFQSQQYCESVIISNIRLLQTSSTELPDSMSSYLTVIWRRIKYSLLFIYLQSSVLYTSLKQMINHSGSEATYSKACQLKQRGGRLQPEKCKLWRNWICELE